MRNDLPSGAALEDPPAARESTPPAAPDTLEASSPPKAAPGPPRLWFRRRRYFVNPRVQGPLLVHALGYAFFFLLVTAVGIFSPLVRDLEGLPVSQQNPFWNPAYSFLYLHYHFWPIALLAVLAIAVHSILSSHRMAGPLYRLSNLFRGMKEGRMPARQVIRKKDFLHPEFEEFNGMVEAWKGKIREFKNDVKDLEKLADLLQEEALLSDSPALLDLVQSITENRRRLAAGLAWFREDG